MPSTIQGRISVMDKKRLTRIGPYIEMAITLPAIGLNSIPGSSMIRDTITPIAPKFPQVSRAALVPSPRQCFQERPLQRSVSECISLTWNYNAPRFCFESIRKGAPSGCVADSVPSKLKPRTRLRRQPSPIDIGEKISQFKYYFA